MRRDVPFPGLRGCVPLKTCAGRPLSRLWVVGRSKHILFFLTRVKVTRALRLERLTIMFIFTLWFDVQRRGPYANSARWLAQLLPLPSASTRSLARPTPVRRGRVSRLNTILLCARLYCCALGILCDIRK